MGDTEDLDQLTLQARRAVERNQPSEAAWLLDRVLTRQPDHGPALLLRGQLWHVVGDDEQALEDWLRVPEEPAEEGAQARFLAGALLLDRHRAREAVENWRRAVELQPEFLPPTELLLKVYVLQRRQREIRDLLDHIRRSRELNLDELGLYVNAGRRIIPSEDAFRQLENFLRGDPNDRASLRALAIYRIDEQQWQEAMGLLEAARVRHPDDDQLRGLLAHVYRQLDRPDDADSLVSDPQPRDRDAWWWWKSAAASAADRGDVARELECHQQLVRINPDDVTGRYRMGQLLTEFGRESEARRHLEASVVLDRIQRQTTIALNVDREQPNVLLPLLIQIGQLLGELEQHRDSVAWFQLATQFSPADEVAGDGLAAAREALAAQQTVRHRDEQRGDETEEKRLTADRPTTRPPSDSIRDGAIREGAITARPAREVEEFVPAPAGDDEELPVIRLRDVHVEAGIDHQYFNGETGFKYLLESMGGGVAVLDYDGDGWPDLYFPQGCRLPYDPDDESFQDRLFRNRGDGTFVDVTRQSGLGDNRYGQGVAVGDLNNNGHVDLVVANYGRNSIFLNNGDGTFDDVTEQWGLADEEMSSSLALADLNRNGYLDLYVVNYVDSLKVCRDSRGQISTCDPQNFGAQQDRLYVNSGAGKFEEVTSSAGIVAADGKGLGVVIADFDEDGWPDIYVANDTTPNFLFHNLSGERSEVRDRVDERVDDRVATSVPQVSHDPADKDSAAVTPLQFVEKGLISGAALSAEGRSEAGMGIALGDFNGDLRSDLFVTNYFLETNTLYVNRGGMAFSDGTRAARLAVPSEPMLGFGTQAIDFDLDGWLDLFVANGHIDNFEHNNEPWKMPPQVFRNLGKGQFREVSGEAGEYFSGRYLGRGVARLDFNRDGRPDVVVVHQDAPTALLLNETEGGNRLVLQLHGTIANRDAVGTRITVRTEGGTQQRELAGGDGFYASNERRQFIGLGQATRVERLEIHWPTGDTDLWEDLPVNCQLTLTQGSKPRVARKFND
jgi:tetratricopeptide (TPR) repeat protein